MGSGQPNRVKSVEIALGKAGDDVEVRAHGLRAPIPDAAGLHGMMHTLGLMQACI